SLTLICVNTVSADCSDNKDICEWINWNPWNKCSRTCGGGTRQRSRSLCCKTGLSFDECLDQCGLVNTASDSETCNGICFNGGIFSSSCSCTDAFYGSCCQTDCPALSECKRRNCTASYNVICKECNDDNVFFKRYNRDKECQRMCSWNNHYCWPGSCSAGGLKKDCTCATGLRKISTDGETSCQPTKAPSILICDTVAIGPNGEKKRAMSSTSSTACQYLQDMYGNYQPSVLEFGLVTAYTIYISRSSRPSFIVEQNFGITDTTIYIKRQSVSGAFATLSTERQLADIDSSQSVISAHRDLGNLTVTASTYKLTNGEALCLEFEAKGGGYLKAKDTRTKTHNLNATSYHKTKEQRKVCYRYDSQLPEHCSKQYMCTYEPLQLNERITRSSVHNVKFNGWMDPVPPGGEPRTASSIESYEIRVNEVLPSKGTLKVDYTTNILSTKVNHTVKNMDLNLTSDTPRLFCLTLEVKDVADNVRQCRRFILYDNTSSIKVWNEKPFRFTFASPATNYTWQNDHNDICISWKDYFYNDFYIHNKLLNPIESDPHGLITGSYDQITGEIPISGTSNVYGIIAYYVSWSLNNGSFPADIPAPTFTNQSFCKDLNVKDGDTYTLNVKAIDIAGHTLSDNRTVFIDRSAPHLSDIWLEKDGYEMLFVHSSTDLSKMKITFHALDKHSGISSVAWIFGSAKSDKELVSWQIGGQKVTEICYSDNKDNKCYCPQIGHCEVFKYYVDLAEYMKDHKIIGEQNKEYFFNISVKNTAGLISEKGITIVVDETPPQFGNVSIEQSNSNVTNDTERYIVAHW
ncbi:uncharacterized protein LOC128223855, partial [Mya arenaria]